MIRQKRNIFIDNFMLLKNLRIKIGVMVLCCLGFLLMSKQGYACSKKTNTIEKVICSKQSLNKTENNNCCQIGSCQKNKYHSNCKGVCGHSSCKCSTTISSSSLLIAFELVLGQHFIEIEENKFGYSQAYYSSGFLSIWLPPKIG